MQLASWTLMAAAQATTTTTRPPVTTSTTGPTSTTLPQVVVRIEQADWPNIVATIAAVVLGGMIALAGSVLVSRHELRRQTRIRMHDELLPEMTRLRRGSELPPDFERLLTELHRAGVLAGKRDFALVNDIFTAFATRKNWVSQCWEDDGMGGRTFTGDQQYLSQLNNRLIASMTALDEHLSGKLRRQLL